MVLALVSAPIPHAAAHTPALVAHAVALTPTQVVWAVNPVAHVVAFQLQLQLSLLSQCVQNQLLQPIM